MRGPTSPLSEREREIVTTKHYIVLTFESRDEEGGKDFEESPILLIPQEIIAAEYRKAFGMELVAVDFDRVQITYQPALPTETVPVRPRKNGKPYYPSGSGGEITPAQISALRGIAVTRNVLPGQSIRSTLADLEKEIKSEAFTRSSASARIDEWKTKPARNIPTGFYVTTDASGTNQFYQVVETRDKDHVYAKKLKEDATGGKYWDWAGGYLEELFTQPSHKLLTDAEADRYGLKKRFRKS